MVKKKHSGGRPVTDLDEVQIRKLAEIQCTMEEIAAVMKCSVDTLERRYAEVIRRGRETGKMSLRRAQFKLALSGNAQLLVWLGRHYLQQREEMTMTSSEPDVRTLLENWEVSARKKSNFDKARDKKIVAIGT